MKSIYHHLFFIFILIIGFNIKGVTSTQHKAHAHGAGEIQLVIEKQKLEMRLEIPAYNVVGFEHAPKNKKQEQIIVKAIQFLKKHKNIAVLEGCKNIQLKVTSSQKKQPSQHSHTHDNHSEYVITYKAQCSKKPEEITFRLFENFPGIKSMKILSVVNDKQNSGQITPNSPIYKL